MSDIYTDDLSYSAFTVEREDGKYRLVIDVVGFPNAAEAHMFLYELMGDADEFDTLGGIH